MFILFSSINLKCDGRFVLIFIQIDTNGFKSLPEESFVLRPNAHLKTVHKLNNIYRLFLVRMLTLSVNYPIFIPLFLLDQILEVKIYINRVILTTCLAHWVLWNLTNFGFLLILVFIVMARIGELIYTCKMVLLKYRLGSNLAFFSSSVNLYIFPGSNLLISC